MSSPVYPTAYAYGHAMRNVGLELDTMLTLFRAYDRGDWDERDFVHGFTGVRPCVHFVGFRGDEYWSAARIWGEPDYIWPQATFRILGECAPVDTVIFGPHAFHKPAKWRRAE